MYIYMQQKVKKQISFDFLRKTNNDKTCLELIKDCIVGNLDI